MVPFGRKTSNWGRHVHFEGQGPFTIDGKNSLRGPGSNSGPDPPLLGVDLWDYLLFAFFAPFLGLVWLKWVFFTLDGKKAYLGKTRRGVLGPKGHFLMKVMAHARQFGA